MITQFDVAEFEDNAHENGQRYWLAHEFMHRLGYKSLATFRNVISRALSLCERVGIDWLEDIAPMSCTDVSGKTIATYRLSRFGCLLITMQADAKKPEVAQAQTAMASVATELVERYLNSNTLERIEKREELKIAEKVLGGEVNTAGVQSLQFGIFKDAGFRGMYNMSLVELKNYKGARDHSGTLYDLMGITELAANTFRVTQTAERLKHTGAVGLQQASGVAQQVGKEVRQVMIKSSGIKPEELPLEEDIKKVHSGIKNTHKVVHRIDAPPKSAKKGKKSNE